MTDKLREKAQQALGALEAAGYGNSYAAIELREALVEQAEQEPVAWIHQLDFGRECGVTPNQVSDEQVPLYAAPVRTKDLTDDEISRLWYDSSYGDSGIDFARAVIAADREKNK